VADVRRLLAAAKDAFGRLDILVNNAGVYEFGKLEEATEAAFQKQFNTNVLGPILVTREALAYFGPKGGSVINLGSITSVNPVPNSVVYSSSKGAVDALTKALANELAGRNIRVNVIAPGMTATEGLAAVGVDDAAAKSIGAGLPMGRIGRPDDIAQVAAFLASDRAAWLTGERITVSGGNAEPGDAGRRRRSVSNSALILRSPRSGRLEGRGRPAEASEHPSRPLA
jgi:3-oxoacyl-[acyl-carrier protein] reductase